MNIGKQDELMDFFLQNRPEIRGFLMKRLRNPEDADDTLQEVFLRIEKYDTKMVIHNVRPFVYRIANNLAIDKIRQRKRLMSHISSEDEGFLELVSNYPSAEQIVYDKFRLNALREALLKLPEKQRMAFILHREEKLTYKEVGLKVGLSESMVKKHVIKTLAHCRKYMRNIERNF